MLYIKKTISLFGSTGKITKWNSFGFFYLHCYLIEKLDGFKKV